MRLVPAEFGEAVIINAEVVGDLVDDGAGDFAAEFTGIVEVLQQREAVDGDAVGERAVLGGAFGQRDTFVEAVEGFVAGNAHVVEQFVTGGVLDDDLDVIHQPSDIGWNQFQSLVHQFGEFMFGEAHGGSVGSG